MKCTLTAIIVLLNVKGKTSNIWFAKCAFWNKIIDYEMYFNGKYCVFER